MASQLSLPSSETFLNLLKLSIQYESHSEAIIVLEDIYRKCDTCQRFYVLLVRFKVSLPNDKDRVFADKISNEFIFLDNHSVLRAVDTETRLFYCNLFN